MVSETTMDFYGYWTHLNAKYFTILKIPCSAYSVSLFEIIWKLFIKTSLNYYTLEVGHMHSYIVGLKLQQLGTVVLRYALFLLHCFLSNYKDIEKLNQVIRVGTFQSIAIIYKI